MRDLLRWLRASQGLGSGLWEPVMKTLGSTAKWSTASPAEITRVSADVSVWSVTYYQILAVCLWASFCGPLLDEFMVSPVEGELRVRKDVELDRETTAFYNITVTARDLGTPSRNSSVGLNDTPTHTHTHKQAQTLTISSRKSRSCGFHFYAVRCLADTITTYWIFIFPSDKLFDPHSTDTLTHKLKCFPKSTKSNTFQKVADASTCCVNMKPQVGVLNVEIDCEGIGFFFKMSNMFKIV